MLKKIFACVFAGMFFVAGAGAAVDPRTECVLANRGVIVANQTSGSEEGAIRSDYTIYFDNDSSDIPTDCTSEVDKLVADLASKQDDIETFLLFGSADGTGNSNYNARLAQNRVNTVANKLKDSGFTDEQLCEYSDDGNVLSYGCARFTMGDAFGRARGYLESSELARAVFMFVIYKGDICDEKTIEALDALSAKVTDTDIKSKLDAAKQICNSNSKDQMLLRSQRQQIMGAISEALQKYPDAWKDVPADLSATILANGIIAVRDSLVRGASVWKTDKGTFNYARLASDSIAGVVLGTAGGIITSNVVKKNQIKSGFEDVMCTVGGQNVANWGDEFRVGVR
ncbi:MAG: OmpA family protein [Alphaproteobacteria bacterium]